MDMEFHFTEELAALMPMTGSTAGADLYEIVKKTWEIKLIAI
jgi:hypothetical protein